MGASFASRLHGVSVKLHEDFSDPQDGKGPCDRKGASLKSHMRVHLNQGSNIEPDFRGNGRRYPVFRGCSWNRCYTTLQLIAKPKTLSECEDPRLEFDFQY